MPPTLAHAPSHRQAASQNASSCSLDARNAACIRSRAPGPASAPAASVQLARPRRERLELRVGVHGDPRRVAGVVRHRRPPPAARRSRRSPTCTAAARRPARRSRRAPPCAAGSPCSRRRRRGRLGLELRGGRSPSARRTRRGAPSRSRAPPGASAAKRRISATRGARAGAEREQPPVVDQEAVVLADVEAEAGLVERAVADPAHERVRVLGLPDVRRRRAQLGGEAHPPAPAGCGAVGSSAASPSCSRAR